WRWVRSGLPCARLVINHHSGASSQSGSRSCHEFAERYGSGEDELSLSSRTIDRGAVVNLIGADKTPFVVVAHDDQRRSVGAGIQEPEVPTQVGEFGMAAALSDADVLAAGDIGPVALRTQLEAQVSGEWVADHVHTLPALPGSAGRGDSTQPRIGSRRALGQRLACQEQRELFSLFVVEVLRKRLQPERGLAEGVEERVELGRGHRRALISSAALRISDSWTASAFSPGSRWNCASAPESSSS